MTGHVDKQPRDNRHSMRACFSVLGCNLEEFQSVVLLLFLLINLQTIHLCPSYRVQNLVGKKELRMCIAVDRVNIKTVLCIKCLLRHFRVCGEEFFLTQWNLFPFKMVVKWFQQYYISKNSEGPSLQYLLCFSCFIPYVTRPARKDMSPWKNSCLLSNVYSKITLKRNTSTHVLESECFLLLLLAIY